MAEKATKISFSSDAFSSNDTADMNVVVGGKPTDWVWTFAGPGHPQAVAQADRVAREALHNANEQERARVNGKKWKPVEETVNELRERTVAFVVERMVGWSPVEIDGKDYPFTPENARALLINPANQSLLRQANDLISDENSFTKR